jgi:hypothetical protein
VGWWAGGQVGWWAGEVSRADGGQRSTLLCCKGCVVYAAGTARVYAARRLGAGSKSSSTAAQINAARVRLWACCGILLASRWCRTRQQYCCCSCCLLRQATHPVFVQLGLMRRCANCTACVRRANCTASACSAPAGLGWWRAAWPPPAGPPHPSPQRTTAAHAP